MIQLPQIDLNGILPVAGLAAIAALCVVALLVHSLLHSRIALLIAVVIGVVLAGPTLAHALVNVVWAIVPLGVVVVAGAVAVLWLLHRNPDLLSLARDVVPYRARYETPPKPLELQAPTVQAPPGAVVINQPQQTVRKTTTKVINGDHWGFW